MDQKPPAWHCPWRRSDIYSSVIKRLTAIIIGLVNASVMPLSNAIWVVFGANIGTTTTGWLVSAAGFDFDIKTFALPFIGAGMLIKTFANRTHLNAIGTALAGFGLFFVGIDILRESFSVYTAQSGFKSISQSGLPSLIWLMMTGFLMTVMTQSSSAATALILTGAAGGMLTLSGGAAMIIGANLGTTSTAVLAVIGTSSGAKRTAAAHVLFNGITAVIALVILPLLLMIVSRMESFLEMPSTPVVSLAMFHTLFNVFGVVLLSPFVPALTRFLEKRFVSPVEREGNPEFLNQSSLKMPALALNALISELGRFKTLACKNVLRAFEDPLNGKADFESQMQRSALSTLSAHISSFAENLAQTKMAEDISATLSAALRINRYLRELAVLSGHVHDTRRVIATLQDSQNVQNVDSFMEKCRAILGDIEHGTSLSETVLTDFVTEYHKTKETILESGARRKLPIEALSAILDHLSAIRRMTEQAIKAERHLYLIRGAQP